MKTVKGQPGKAEHEQSTNLSEALRLHTGRIMSPLGLHDKQDSTSFATTTYIIALRLRCSDSSRDMHMLFVLCCFRMSADVVTKDRLTASAPSAPPILKSHTISPRVWIRQVPIMILILPAILTLASCEDRPELQDGSYLAISDIDRGDGWVAWFQVEVQGGSVSSARFDYVHREDGRIFSETENTINGEDAQELFSDYADAFAAEPGPDFDIDRGPSSVSRHISALSIGIVETSTRGQTEPVLVSAPGDGQAIDAEEILSFLPVTPSQ